VKVNLFAPLITDNTPMPFLPDFYIENCLIAGCKSFKQRIIIVILSEAKNLFSARIK